MAAHGLPKAPTAGAPRATPVGGSPPLAKPDGKAARAKADRAKADTVEQEPVKRGRVTNAFTRATTPAAGVPITASAARDRLRPPTDPEIETYLELEADLPPQAGDTPDLESELALSRAFSGEHVLPEIAADDTTTRVTETDDGSELTVTVVYAASPAAPPRDPDRKRAITAEDATAVSGTIPDHDDDRRAARDGRDD